MFREDVTLKESNQEIRLWTQPDSEGNWSNLHLAMQNVIIGDFAPFITKKNRIEGLLNGEAIVIDPQNKFNITTDLHVTELRLDNDSLGSLMQNLITIINRVCLPDRLQTIDPEHHIDIDLAMNLNDTNHVFRDRINTRLTNFELKYLNRFLGAIFSDIQGYVTGNFDITGEGSDWNYTAKAKLKDASLKVNFTQVTYKIEDTELEMTRTGSVLIISECATELEIRL